MRVKSITANNFKSLVEFKLDLTKFTCLIGLNGAGKSTVLQFIDFLAQQVRGDLEGWLEERNWRSKDLYSRLTSKKKIDFEVEIIDDSDQPLGSWQASFNTSKLSCTSERLSIGGKELQVADGAYSITERHPNGSVSVSVQVRPLNANGPTEKSIDFSYQGSILSQLKETGLPEPILKFKRFFENIRSLDLLSPDQLRQRTRESMGSLGLGGKWLSSFLHELGHEKLTALTDRLKLVYKHLDKVRVRSLRSGWKQLEIEERYGEKSLVTEARHINDGMLRLTAILSELGSDHRFVLLDEIENGINPEVVEFVIDLLTTTPKQVLVTTHSPMILNYLEDEVARSAVVYLYKTSDGFTKAIPFFSIPSMAEKLSVMGPGEAFVDTILSQLVDEIAEMTGDQ